MHISTNDFHCCKPAHLLQLAPSGGRPRRRPPATAGVSSAYFARGGCYSHNINARVGSATLKSKTRLSLLVWSCEIQSCALDAP